jgi:hypothetical protein
MYKIDLSNKTLYKIDSTILKNENLLERHDLQQFIFNSWESFKNDIGLPTTILIGKEIKPHDSVQDSIDLLAFDQDDSSLIIIELKRDKNKFQLLQALSYAAMVATWDSEKLIKIVERGKTNFSNEAIDLIKNTELNNEVKIVLISEYYDPEVIITSNWLSSNYGVSITAFSVGLHKIDNQLLLEIDQKYPLPELSETYESRRKRNLEIINDEITWEQVIPNLKYDFAQKGIDICRKIKGEGDPKRRRFGDIVKNFEGFNWISLNFREKYINVYTGCDDKQTSIKRINEIFGQEMIISEWRDGISFNISDKKDFDKLLKWLKIE